MKVLKTHFKDALKNSIQDDSLASYIPAILDSFTLLQLKKMNFLLKKVILVTIFVL
ncbi:hypothetical protein [Lacinutrix jangbogonensis]|uniref:hypothetical protein n=1 Tax=Lacinutrix jangbogonensis TaxID=1469557 RepID=UPI000A756D19|nr:hypothetical protein [Lacinutrix jangbogonensis]